MRLNKAVVMISVVLTTFLSVGLAQTPPREGKKASGPSLSYNPGGRRDPFLNLLGGSGMKEKKVIGRLSDLSIEDVTLMGIVKAKDVWEAIISLTEGFPITIHEGDRLSDGYVLSIEGTHVVFRKTRDSKGLPLAKPKDIIKEFIPEER